MIGRFLGAGAFAVLMIGCGGGERNVAADGGAMDRGDSTEATAAASNSVNDSSGVVLFVGTSLTAGLGVDESQAFPMLIAEKIDSAGLPYRVVNAGISGETSAGALDRVDWVLRQPFDVLVLETGANDMLRGVPPAVVERNIQAIVDRVRETNPGARVVLAGMRAAPNLGAAYVADFEAIYPRLARRNGLPLIPFVLEGVAAIPDLNQGDGIHPNPAGHRAVADHVWESLLPLLREKTDSNDERDG